MSEEKLQIDAARGMRAKVLLENELLNEAFAELEASYIATWRATGVHDNLGREKLFIAVNVLGKVKAHLHAVVSNGKVATAELEELTRRAERRRRLAVV